MNPELQMKVIEIIDQLATQFGVAKEFLWEVLLQQQYVEAAQLLVGACFLVGVIIFGYWLFRKGVREEFKTSEGDVGATVFGMGVCLGGAGGLLATLCSAIGRLINPEFYALQEILRMVTNGG
jgi:hypothetical protein